MIDVLIGWGTIHIDLGWLILLCFEISLNTRTPCVTNAKVWFSTQTASEISRSLLSVKFIAPTPRTAGGQNMLIDAILYCRSNERRCHSLNDPWTEWQNFQGNLNCETNNMEQNLVNWIRVPCYSPDFLSSGMTDAISKNINQFFSVINHFQN